MTKFVRLGCALLAGLIASAGVSAANLTPVDAGGGALSPPVARDGYLYVGTGATLSVWNMADPANPVYAGRSADAPAAGPIRALTMVGDYLYAAWNTPSDKGGLTVYSLDDPAHPAVVAEIDDYIASDFKRPSGLAASGNYVYVGDADNGLVVLDATDPLNPTYLGLVDGVFEFDAMATFGDTLLATGTSFIGGRNVDVIDLTNPAAPVLAGQTSLDGNTVLRAVLTDGYAIGVGIELQVYDLSDPSNIQEVFSTPIDTATQAIRDGDTLYLVGASGIQVWDFTTPSTPALVRTVAMDAFLPDQVVDAPFGPVILTHTDRGLVLDTADPQNPTLASSFVLPFGVAVHAGAFDATHAYFAEEAYGLSAMSLPSLDAAGRYDADLPPDPAARDMEDISVDGGRAYLAAWGYGVLIVDLSDPSAPVGLGRFEFPFASTIEAHGDRVYVASTTNGGIFKILDVSDPTAPSELGSLTTSQTYGLTVRGDYAYLVDGADFGDGGLRVVDVSNASAPTVVGQDTGCAYAVGIDVSADGNTAYVACASDENFANALRIVDTTDKSNPVVIGSVALPGSTQLPDFNTAYAVIVDGDTAYVGNEYGVDEVDISDPAHPVQTVRHETGYTVRSLARDPSGRILAFAGEAGTFVFDASGGVTDDIFSDGFDP
jgi:hypothetical protein